MNPNGRYKKRSPGYDIVMGQPGIEDKIIQWCSAGYNQKYVAHRLGIHYDTLRKWKRNKPEFKSLLETGRVELEGIITQQFFKKILGDSTTKKTEVSVTKDKKGNVVSTTTKQTITEAPPSDALLLAVMQKVCNWENEGEDEENVITVTTTPTNTKSMQDIVAELKKMKYAKGMG